MKSLIVLRHGKSDWRSINQSDHERGLKHSGKSDARNIGIELQKRNINEPDIIISSSANRALSTVKIVRQFYGKNVELDIQNAFYTFSLDKVIENIGHVDKKVNRLMIVGHNPAYTYLINYLSNSKLDNFPTCGVALLMLKIDKWNQLTQNCGILEDTIFPKALR